MRSCWESGVGSFDLQPRQQYGLRASSKGNGVGGATPRSGSRKTFAERGAAAGEGAQDERRARILGIDARRDEDVRRTLEILVSLSEQTVRAKPAPSKSRRRE